MWKQSRLTGVVLALAGSAVIAGQAPAPPTSPETPTFKLQVDYIEVDVLVTDVQGAFVRDLKKEDFQVYEDGKPQSIAGFGIVDIPVERYERPLFAARPIEPDVMSNERPFDGRIYVLVIDDLQTNASRTQLVKNAAHQFIEQRLGANDLAAVVHTQGRADANQDFTNNKRLLLAAVDRTIGEKVADAMATGRGGGLGGRFPNTQDAERGFNARRTLETLRDVAGWFSSVRGRRKSILFFSEGIDYDLTNMFSGGSSASIVLQETQDAITNATRSNVSIYAIDPRGLTNLADDTIRRGSMPVGGMAALMNGLQLSQDSLRQLSEQTGGFAVVNSNDYATAFDRIVRDNSSYYVIAYYPPPDRHDGKFHDIQVKVDKPGLTVRSRRGYVSAKGKPAAPPVQGGQGTGPASAQAARPAPGQISSPEVREALASPLPVSGLTVRVFAAPFRGAAPNASVLLGAEVAGGDLKLDASEKATDMVEISYVAIDAEGKIRASNSARINMNLKPDTLKRVEENGVRVLNRLEMPPNRYQIRVAARDSNGGALGTVLYNLEVPDFNKGPLAMSGIVMTSIAGSQTPTVRTDELLQPALPAPPAALRAFPPNDEVAIFTEVYDNQGGAAAHKVDITSTVTTDEGKVVFKHDEERSSTELQSKRGGYGYSTRVPLKDLPPGLYVLKVSAHSSLGRDETVAREVQFNIVTGKPTQS